MSLENIKNIAGMAMDAQTVRLNLSVSNIANAETLASSPEDAYKAKRPVFKTVLENEVNESIGRVSGGVYGGRAEDTTPVPSHDPSSPMADETGTCTTPTLTLCRRWLISLLLLVHLRARLRPQIQRSV